MRDYVILNSDYSSAFPVKKNWSLPPPHATQSQPCCSLPPCESQFCSLIRLNTPGSTDPGPVLKRRRIPLPYLIRPRRKLPVYDSYSLYDDYIGYLSNKVGLKSDEGDVETSSLEKGNESNAMLCGTGSLSDEEYVVVDNVEVSPNSKTERAGAIQMMELSKDGIEESESGGSDSDAWVVV
ncbi:hypothetical protein IGI04_031036 [Brassica rapa subsp. trilocularis]|uniref:Uncharacterized protein n=1 Tax=Brassica rapa subsp. trilocularis TaxID=1813537 RepID=A0ABQ7LU08_BRACM|nr:hypothetical protein IGI04_031036 [Brassica rapa subsp. trilocularis]